MYDYLDSTELDPEIAVPQNSMLGKKIQSALSRYRLRYFTNKYLVIFYLKIFIDIFFNKYQSIYINEAGHVKYILVLAKIFAKKNFIIHVRIIEDTDTKRWIMVPGKNVTVLSISGYIQAALPVSSQLLYDPFHFTESKDPGRQTSETEVLRVGVIGRVTRTKGLDRLIELVNVLRAAHIEKKIIFKLFGSISTDAYTDNWLVKLTCEETVTMEGFFDNPNEMYQSVDCILHLSGQEALGRIFLEAINEGKPFIGLNAAGIGEIGGMLGLTDFLVPVGETTVFEITEKLKMIAGRYTDCCKMMIAVKEKAAGIFGMNAYVKTLDKILAG